MAERNADKSWADMMDDSDEEVIPQTSSTDDLLVTEEVQINSTEEWLTIAEANEAATTSKRNPRKPAAPKKTDTKPKSVSPFSKILFQVLFFSDLSNLSN